MEKRGTQIEIENSGYNLAGFDHFKSEYFLELKRVKLKDFEDLVYRKDLTYDEIVDILNVKYFAGSNKDYSLPPAVYKVDDHNLILKSLLLNKVKLNLAIDDFKLKSSLTTKKIFSFTEKSFFILY